MFFAAKVRKYNQRKADLDDLDMQDNLDNQDNWDNIDDMDSIDDLDE